MNILYHTLPYGMAAAVDIPSCLAHLLCTAHTGISALDPTPLLDACCLSSGDGMFTPPPRALRMRRLWRLERNWRQPAARRTCRAALLLVYSTARATSQHLSYSLSHLLAMRRGRQGYRRTRPARRTTFLPHSCLHAATPAVQAYAIGVTYPGLRCNSVTRASAETQRCALARHMA